MIKPNLALLHKGYTPLVVSVFLMIAGIIGGVSWYMVSNHINMTQQDSIEVLATNDMESPSDDHNIASNKELVDSPQNQKYSVTSADSGMSVYENTSIGFAFMFPAQQSSAIGCQERATVIDRDGTQVSLDRPIQSSYFETVDQIVVTSNYKYVIAAPKILMHKGEYRTPGGISYPTTCISKDATMESIEQASAQREYYFYPSHATWFVYKNVSDSTLAQTIRKIEDEVDVTMQYSLGSLADDRMPIELTHGETGRIGESAYGYVTGGWYYPEKRLLAVLTSWRGYAPEHTMYLQAGTDQDITVQNMLSYFRAL